MVFPSAVCLSLIHIYASKFEEFNVSILGAVGQDSYAKFIMDSVSDKRIDVAM